MGFWNNLVFGPSPGERVERKTADMPLAVETVNVKLRSPEEVEADLWARQSAGDMRFTVSAVLACARVIAEGLASPPCAIHQVGARGKSPATRHPLHYLLSASPNARQTSYEFREQLGFHLALGGNAFVWINRLRDGSIGELVPLDPSTVSKTVDEKKIGSPVIYSVGGKVQKAGAIWHLKGPAWLSHSGLNMLDDCRIDRGVERPRNGH